jgi:hypothetical protein
MLQLLELILGSQIVALVFSALRYTVYAGMVAADCEECGFNDLGKLLFGGMILALVVGVGASLWWRRQKENDSKSDFVSIRSDEFQKPNR